MHEEMGMTDLQFKSWLQQLVSRLKDEEKIFGNKKGIINIDTISRNFEAGDIVTVNSLKDKKIDDIIEEFETTLKN